MKYKTERTIAVLLTMLLFPDPVRAVGADQSPPAWLGDLEPIKDNFTVRPDRPRLYLNRDDLAGIRSRARASHQDEWESIRNALYRDQERWYDIYSVYSGTNVREAVASNLLTDLILANAFTYLVDGDPRRARTAIELALRLSADTTGGDLPNAYRVWPEAIAYDWCHEHVKPGEGEKLLENVRVQLRFAGGDDLEQRTVHMGHLVNYLADAFLPAGIAFFEEAPDIFRRAVEVIRAEIPAKNVFYRFGLSSQGDSYGATHYQGDIRILVMLRKATGVDLFRRYPFYRDVAYYWIYTRRPDGQFLRNGDEWMDSLNLPAWGPRAAWGCPWLAEALLYAAGAYGDPYLTGEYLRTRSLDHVWLSIADIIHRDSEVKPKPPDDLPPARWLDGAAGTLLFRTGWGPDDAVGMFKVMPLYVKNHDHLDRLSFQIYCRGALAIDSGIYEGVDSDYGLPHWINYLQRTVAHNSILIRDPDEKVLHYGREVRADGGQRFPGDGRDPMTLDDLRNPIWQVARVMAHELDQDGGRYAFVSADAAPAYGAKAETVRRDFVFLGGFRSDASAGLPTAAVVIRDRVVSARPEFHKVWLFHIIEEPEIDGSAFTVRKSGPEYGGALVSLTLLPERARLEKIGGPGREFWVDGINYATTKGGPCEEGAWRVEVSPSVDEKQAEFLHVFLIYPASPGRTPEVRAVRGGPFVGAEFLDRTVVLCDTADFGVPLEYSTGGKGRRYHLVLGLPAEREAGVSVGGKAPTRRRISPAGAMSFQLDQDGATRVRITVR